jgi:hypothetical protein
MKKIIGICIIALAAFMIGSISTPIQVVCSVMVLPVLAILVAYLFRQETDDFVPPITRS